ncbi:MAG TPA: protein kinase [Cyanobacteria bacterium UBA9273]|nr:protein kinase [Cyanobacteria bacterium UBA9273]
MSYCINPSCPEPEDPANTNNRICRHCGSELLLQGRYQVMRLLSDTSGFGKVYEAYEGTTPKILKVLKPKHNNNPRVIELFQQEAVVLSQLNHPGIPKVESDSYFQFFSRKGTEPLHCIIMEKIDGLNLKQWMKQQGNHPISEEQALDWLKQLVKILHLVHQKNYFHRDIKPENIMLRADGQLVLIDFGTARELTYTYLAEVGGAGSVTRISSAGYTPPEQEKGHAVPQSDFYALGRTFVYLLTAKQVTDQIIYDPLTDQCNWRNQAPSISPQLANFIDKLMAPRATDRHKNTQDILDDIAHFGQDLSPAESIPESATYVEKTTTNQSSSLPAPDKISSTTQQVIKPQKKWLIVGTVTLIVGWGGYGMWQFYQNSIPTVIPILNGQTGELSYVNYLAFTADGKRLLSGTADNKIRLWDLTSGKKNRTIVKYSIPINFFALGPYEQTIATGGANNTIKIWEFSTGKLIRTIVGHSSYINYLLVSNDGKKVVSASADNTVRIWDFDTGKLIQTLKGHSSPVNYLAITHDGKKIASASADTTIIIWDFDTDKLLQTLKGHASPVKPIVISNDDKKLVSGSADGTMKIWDLVTYQEIRTMKGHSSSVNSLAISPDGKKLVSGSADGKIKIWNLATYQEIRTWKGHSSSVNSLAISPDGKKLVSGGADGRIKIWRMPN